MAFSMYIYDGQMMNLPPSLQDIFFISSERSLLNTCPFEVITKMLKEKLEICMCYSTMHCLLCLVAAAHNQVTI